MKNVELLVRILEHAGVRWIFGVPSGPVLPLIEALRKSSIRFVLTASETSAGFMASTVGYLTGTPGVCVSTLGPGATNLTTGVGCAWLDRAPVLALTCNVASRWLERRTQMRIDHEALFRPLTKASFSARSGRLGPIVGEALQLATSEPPGPVHIDIPEDIGETAAEPAEGAFASRPAQPPAVQAREAAEAVAAALRRARRPLVAAGLTFTRSGAAESLLRFIEKQNVPFVTTLHAKGFLPESHPHWAGVIGRARRSDVKRFTDRADLIVAIGYDPVEINYEEWAGPTSVVHISSEGADASGELNLLWNQAADLDGAIVALADLSPFGNEWTIAEWREHRAALERALRPENLRFPAHRLIDLAREMVPADGILACDVGAHTHQIASQWRVDRPRTLLATNGWSSMGYAMPAAYAAKIVHPERTVVCIVGDGGFQMTAGELALARRLRLAVPVIVLNDGWLGLMKVKQERKGYPLSGVYLGEPPDSPPHYFGVPCRAASDPQSFRAALAWALELGGPSVIEAAIDVEAYSETVFD
ncbi:MAG TPA: thiamine pyrophosphate-binding protein [Candidatus Eisenbacteria bacterium]|nr:thiamine pyrophosphate-binding protein [Candidatus Eisenbacteria bacterium]